MSDIPVNNPEEVSQEETLQTSQIESETLSTDTIDVSETVDEQVLNVSENTANALKWADDLVKQLMIDREKVNKLQ